MSGAVSHPIGPTMEIETLLAQLADRAGQVIDAQARLRELVQVNNDLTSNLDLPTVLRRIVEIGMGLLHARYGAMGVIGPDGDLAQFIHVGIDADGARLIGSLPKGKGLLGAVIQDPVPVRLEHLSDDDRSSGFPPHHPPMDNFLGVPVRIGDVVFGNLYLTDSLNGAFSPDDEELAQALAATAAVAVQNARLYEDSEYRARWSTALADVTRHLLSTEDGGEIDILVERVFDLAGAELVSVMLLAEDDDSRLRVDRARGTGDTELMAMTFAVEGTIAGEAITSAQPVVVADVSALADHGFPQQERLGTTMVVPFTTGGRVGGALCVSRGPQGGAFTDRDLDMASSFARHISVAMERSAAREDRRRYALLEDRARIARDLHDFVIQQLFGTGLSLQAIAGRTDPETAQAITTQIAAIDGAIAQICQSIFAMQRDPSSTTVSLRSRVLEIADQVVGGVRPRVSFLGPVDLVADASVTDDVAAVITEGVTNAVKHASATSIDATVTAAGGQIVIEIVDDGVGVATREGWSGLSNLRDRAERHGGTFEVASDGGRGTRLTWAVPV